MKLIVIIMLSLAGVAAAQAPVGGSAASPAPATPPVGGSAASPDAEALRKICADAMNADPGFAKSIALTVDKQIDQKTIDAHLQAAQQIRENERHVLYAYVAMWVIAALFVAFLWYRQRQLVAEIGVLRRDLEAAAKDDKKDHKSA